MLSAKQWRYFFQRVWRYLRQVTGDDAYERYLQHCEVFHPDQVPLSRKDYFKQEQSRKWDGIRRCC
jgi:uncharacterized short protein YbdD (DUF466 family)